MRVVVAGSSGLIGTALVPVLREAEHEVLRLVRRRPTAPDEREWDPYAGKIQDGALDGADAVINLCGASIGLHRWSQAHKQQMRDSRVISTELLSTVAAEQGVGHLINASGVHFYGDTRDRVTHETAPAGTGFLANLCREWEEATAPASASGVRVALLRTGLVLSPSGGLLGPMKQVFSLFLGGRLGSGRQYLPWISLDDEVSAIRFVLEHEEIRGPVNLSGPAPVTNAEFTHALGDALGRPTPWVIPAFGLRLIFGEMASETMLSGPRVVPTILEQHGFRFRHPSLGAALTAVIGR